MAKNTPATDEAAVATTATAGTAPRKEYTEEQAQVIQEKTDLDLKIAALREFMGTKQHDKLDQTNKQLLQRQLHVMTAYSVVLGQRIDLF